MSAAATRDYFSWNRARWNAIRTAERLGATADTLDGGFEYNGLRRYEQKPRTRVPGKSWWWVKDDRYVVAFSSLPGYEEIETWRVEHWLSRSPPEVKLPAPAIAAPEPPCRVRATRDAHAAMGYSRDFQT